MDHVRIVWIFSWPGESDSIVWAQNQCAVHITAEQCYAKRIKYMFGLSWMMFDPF